MPFYMIDNWSGRNTFDKEIAEKFIADYPEFKIQEVREIPCRTLQDIFEHELNRVMPDYMSIDIEGFEYDALKNFDLKNNGPKIVTIEKNCDLKLLLELFKDAEYCIWFRTHNNYTFIKNTLKQYI